MSAHSIVHVEIPANDFQAADTFYGELFGWQLEVDQKFDYHMFRPASGPGGAFRKPDDFFRVDHVLVYVDSDDIDLDLKKAEALGATVVVPTMEIPDTGWLGVFADPTGNKIGLFRSMVQRT